ncbi:MAG: hypothetical protein ACYCX4_11570, partial [Bacillota bacterium]
SSDGHRVDCSSADDHRVVYSSADGHRVVCSSADGHRVVCSSADGHRVVCSSADGHRKVSSDMLFPAHLMMAYCQPAAYPVVQRVYYPLALAFLGNRKNLCPADENLFRPLLALQVNSHQPAGLETSKAVHYRPPHVVCFSLRGSDQAHAICACALLPW